MLQLSKHDTYSLILESIERSKKQTYSFSTKLEWTCLRCTTPIYVEYKRVTKLRDIYCCDCVDEEMNGDRSQVKKIIQLRFIQQIDTKKLKMFDQLFNHI